MITIEVRGMSDVLNMVKDMRAQFPKAAGRSSERICRQIQKRARTILQGRVWKDTSTGTLAQSITVRPRTMKGKIISHTVGPDRRIAPYADIIETGVSGRHAAPIMRRGEIVGFVTRPGGMLPSTGGRFFMRDAFFDVYGKARGIVLDEMEKYVARYRK
jgi:hypothetical protein